MHEFSMRLLAGLEPAHETAKLPRGNLGSNVAMTEDFDADMLDMDGDLPRISLASDSVMVDGDAITVGELVEKYHELKRQLRICELNLDNALILKENRECQPSEPHTAPE